MRIAAAAEPPLATGNTTRGTRLRARGLPCAPVARDAVPSCDRPLVALDPDGVVVDPGEIPPRSLLVFGTERYGISEEIERKADMRVRIPMREGVSSLNVATAVAAVLYAMKWGEAGDRGR